MSLRNGTLGVLASFTVGAGVALGVLTNYTQPSEPASTQVNVVGATATAVTSITPSESPTPTESTTAVEGDDGSLGGPVLNPDNQVTPTYIIKSPAPTHEEANDDTAAVATPSEAVTHTATAEAAPTRPVPPQVSKTPSPDDHSETPAP